MLDNCYTVLGKSSKYTKSRVVDPHPDPDPVFFLIADPDPVPNPGF
jgi:hypothetical protein